MWNVWSFNLRRGCLVSKEQSLLRVFVWSQCTLHWNVYKTYGLHDACLYDVLHIMMISHDLVMMTTQMHQEPSSLRNQGNLSPCPIWWCQRPHHLLLSSPLFLPCPPLTITAFSHTLCLADNVALNNQGENSLVCPSGCKCKSWGKSSQRLARQCLPR